MKYKHLTEEERYHIAAYKKAGYKQKDMAKELGPKFKSEVQFFEIFLK